MAEFFVAAIVNPALDTIEITKLNSILNEFFVGGDNTIQVGQHDGTNIKFSNFTATNDIGTALPSVGPAGNPFIGVAVREIASSPNNDWYVENAVRKAPSSSSPYACNEYDLILKPSTVLELLEVNLLMQKQFDRDVKNFQAPPFTLSPRWSYPGITTDGDCFVEYAEHSQGFASYGAPIYYELIDQVYYICSENFTGSTKLEDVAGQNIGAIVYPF